MPLARRLPYKRGFTNINKIYYKAVNLKQLAEFDFDGLDVTPEIMAAVGLVKKETDPIAILGDGELNVALTVKAQRFSASAKEKIEAAGGTVEVLPLS